MDEGVSISLKAISRAWRRTGESVMLTFTPLAGHEPNAVADALRAAVTAANEEEWERTDGAAEVGGGSIAGTLKGAVAFIDFCDTPRALRWFLETIAKHLEAQGYSGRLGPAREAIAPLDMHLGYVDVLAAGMTVPIDYDAFVADHNDSSRIPKRWYGDDHATNRVLEVLTGWVLAGPGKVYLRQGIPQIQVRPQDALDLITSGVRRESGHSLKRAESEQQVRILIVDLDGLGHFTLQEISTRPWQERVADLTEPLMTLAPDLEAGLVRQAKHHGDWTQLVNRFDPLPPGGLRGGGLGHLRHLESSRTLDAYGVQILNDAHVSHTEDLSAWEVATVAPGRHLVRARDLAPWFETDPPSTATLERARLEFGDAILREQHYVAEPSRWHGYGGQQVQSRSLFQQGQD